MPKKNIDEKDPYEIAVIRVNKHNLEQLVWRLTHEEDGVRALEAVGAWFMSHADCTEKCLTRLLDQMGLEIKLSGYGGRSVVMKTN